MTDRVKLQRDLERGHAAGIVYEQLEDRFLKIADDLHEKWESSEDAEVRDDCWRDLKALRRLQRSFMSDFNAAKLAQAELEKLNG